MEAWKSEGEPKQQNICTLDSLTLLEVQRAMLCGSEARWWWWFFSPAEEDVIIFHKNSAIISILLLLLQSS